MIDMIHSLSNKNIDLQQLINLFETRNLTQIVNKLKLSQTFKNTIKKQKQIFYKFKICKTLKLSKIIKLQHKFFFINTDFTALALNLFFTLFSINNLKKNFKFQEQQKQKIIQEFYKLPILLELPSTSATKTKNKKFLKKLKTLNNFKNSNLFSYYQMSSFLFPFKNNNNFSKFYYSLSIIA